MTIFSAEIRTQHERAISGSFCLSTRPETTPKVSLYVNKVYVTSVYAKHVNRSSTSEQKEQYEYRFPIRPSLRKSLPIKSQVSVKVKCGSKVIGDRMYANTNYEGLFNDDGNHLESLLTTHRVNGWGFLVVPFEKNPQKKFEMLKQYEVSRSLFNLFGFDVYVTGGNLLGIVRDGDFISHDDDLDCCLCFQAEGAEDAAVQYIDFLSKLIPAALASGFDIFDMKPGHFHLSSNRYKWHVDCLAGWIQPNGEWYRLTSFGGQRGVSNINCTTKRLHGVDVLVPVDAERELEITYGSGWRTPQKTYRHVVNKEPKGVLKRFNAAVSGYDQRVKQNLPELKSLCSNARSILEREYE